MANIQLKDGELAKLQITKEQEKEISNIYHQTYIDLKKQMDTLSHEGSTSESLKKTYLNKLVKQLKSAYKSTGPAIEKQIKKGIFDMSQAVVGDNSSWVQKAGLKMEGLYSFVPENIVSILSSGKLYGEDWSLSKAIWGDSQKKAHDIDQIVAAGVAANKSAFDIAKDLEQYVNPSARKDWRWSKVYPGTSKRVDYNAQRLARTMVSHAYQQSLLATTKHNPFVTGYKWSSAHTHRTCEICNERDGKVYSADDLPLDHPNGMCTIMAELSDDMNTIADRLGDWAQGADDSELDQWYASMIGGSLELKPIFNELQEKWLGGTGYSPDKLPSDFTEWSHSLTSAQKKEIFDTLGLHGVEHPFQKINQWYDANLTNIEKRMVFIPPKATTNLSGDMMAGAYSQARKDAALWAKSSEEADKRIRGKCGEVWRAATYQQREGAYHYTWGSGPFNSPLRDGLDWDMRGDYRGKIQGLTELISKSTYDFDMWLQRGVDDTGSTAFLGLARDLSSYSEAELKKEILGKVFTDDAFTSTATAKGKGFSGNIFNVYAPSGTQMIYAEPFSHYSPDRHTTGGMSWDGITPQGSFGSESEMILQRGTSYRITKVEKSGSTWYFDMEVVGQEPLPEGQTHKGR